MYNQIQNVNNENQQNKLTLLFHFSNCVTGQCNPGCTLGNPVALLATPSNLFFTVYGASCQQIISYQETLVMPL